MRVDDHRQEGGESELWYVVRCSVTSDGMNARVPCLEEDESVRARVTQHNQGSEYSNTRKNLAL